MSKIEVISANTEERPHYVEFTKGDFVGFNPTMVNLDYDPFPTNNLNDVVRTEIIARELVLHAKLKGDVLEIRPGVAVSIEGRNFPVTRSEMQIDTQGENSTADIEGVAFLTPCDPLKVLAQLREALSEK